MHYYSNQKHVPISFFISFIFTSNGDYRREEKIKKS